MTTSAPDAIAFAMSPGVPDAAVGDDGDGVAGERLHGVIDGRHLRHADAGDHAGRTDAPRALTDLHRVRARIRERERAVAGRDVPRDQLDVVRRLQLADDVENAVRVAVSRVHDEHVHLRVDERGCALQRVRADADRRAHSKAALRVLRRIRVLDPLRDVLDRDEPREASFVIDDRQLLDLVAVEDRLGLLERRADRSGDEVPARHQRGDGLRGVGLEAEVAVREDADEDAVVVDDRNAGDPVALHELQRVGDEVARPQRHGLDDHARLRALHLVHLGDLIGDREVAVDDPETALARERDREARLGDGVHRRRDQRDVQRDGRCEPRDRRDVVREDVRLGRKQQHVVEREPFLAELPLERDEALDLLLAKLGLHQTTLAAPGDGDQAYAMPSPSKRSRRSAAPVASPFSSSKDRANVPVRDAPVASPARAIASACRR